MDINGVAYQKCNKRDNFIASIKIIVEMINETLKVIVYSITKGYNFNEQENLMQFVTNVTELPNTDIYYLQNNTFFITIVI